MPNIAAILKEEIQRLARKEIRATVNPLKKRVAELARTNAVLKRSVPQLEKTVARLNEEAKKRDLHAVQKGTGDTKGTRLGPRSIRAQRKRLKLSRKDFGTLAGVTANSIYLWETDEVAPKEKNRAALISLRGLGVRDAKRLLEAATTSKSKKAQKTQTSSRKRRKRTTKGRRKK